MRQQSTSFMRRILTTLLLVLATLPAWSQDSFVIEDIRLEGLQRISEGTVFSYLPVEVGDRLDASDGRLAIRELYSTGFFQDITLARDDDILVIRFEERPAIAEVTITGNKQIKTEDIMPALQQIGIAEGEVFNRLQLDRVEQELVRTYYNQGRYGVEIDPRVTQLERNRVNISILVAEGDQSKIRHINIVGNEAFTEEELREDFEADSKRGLAFWKGRNQYSREKLQGDLETLRSHYLDRGYLDFAIESTQVSISPDKQDIYITANVREGEVYTVTGISLTGELILPEENLRRLVAIEEGELFSRRLVEQTADSISSLLANLGYAFANVNPVPDIDEEAREVSINFFIDPGKRVYVRRVEFEGNTRTADEVLRREMRQFEGAWFSQAAIDRSKNRLQRLPYFESVDIETPRVEGSDDQIDVVVNVEERNSGQFSIGLGYSQVQGLITSLSISQENFLGTGKRVSASVSNSSILKRFSLSYNDPYFTDDGVSLGYSLRYSEFNQSRANISSFTTSVAAAGVNFGFPVTEVDYLRFGASFRRTDINIGTFTQIDPDCEENCEFGLGATRPLAISLDENQDGFLTPDERRINTYALDGSWSRDSRNHYLNPTAGSLQRLGFEVAVPGSTREWYKVNLRLAKYWPLFNDLSFAVKTDIAYGDSYDDYDDRLDIQPIELDPADFAGSRRCRFDDIVTFDDGLPFYEHFFGGGVSDIRGFEDNTLGPQDLNCLAVGGDFKVTGGVELGFPLPIEELSGMRLAWFTDVGNVFRDFDSFETSDLRASTGLSLTWEAPVGPIVINVAYPLREEEGDQTELFQFSFGTSF